MNNLFDDHDQVTKDMFRQHEQMMDDAFKTVKRGFVAAILVWALWTILCIVGICALVFAIMHFVCKYW